jgi:hypothetical protein
VDQVGGSHGSRQPSLRLQVLLTLCYLQGWNENLMPMKEPVDKTRVFRNLLKGQALSYFEHHLIRRLEAEDSDVPDN